MEQAAQQIQQSFRANVGADARRAPGLLADAAAQLAFTEVDNPFSVSVASWGASWVDADGDLDLVASRADVKFAHVLAA